MDIDKILEIIQRKVLKGTHLTIEIKEIQAGYLCSPYFKDLYMCHRHENQVKEKTKRFRCTHSIWGSGMDASRCADK